MGAGLSGAYPPPRHSLVDTRPQILSSSRCPGTALAQTTLGTSGSLLSSRHLQVRKQRATGVLLEDRRRVGSYRGPDAPRRCLRVRTTTPGCPTRPLRSWAWPLPECPAH